MTGSPDPRRAAGRRRRTAAVDVAGLLAVGGAVAGIVHLLAPGWLLGVARIGYERVLAVTFRPREPATRLVGLAMLAGAAGLAVARRIHRRFGDRR